MDADHLIALTIEQRLQQARTEASWDGGSGNSSLEDPFQDGARLHDIELSTEDAWYDRPRQTGLEKINRGCNAKEERERNLVAP